MSEVHLINDKSWTPQNVVTSLPLKEIKKIVILYEHSDGTYQTVCSYMTTRDVIFFNACLDRRARYLLDTCCE